MRVKIASQFTFYFCHFRYKSIIIINTKRRMVTRRKNMGQIKLNVKTTTN